MRILPVFFQRAAGQNFPAFHVEVILRAGQRIIIAGLFDRSAVAAQSASELRTAYALNPLFVPV